MCVFGCSARGSAGQGPEETSAESRQEDGGEALQDAGQETGSEALPGADQEAGQQGEWELTQYACASGNVGMFYSLMNTASGEVILIDSGNPANAEQVRGVIRKAGGHVDAWILTHYHEDHIGAFNEIYEQYKDQIGQIYVTPMDRDLYMENAHSWDRVEVYTRFLEITEGAQNIISVNRGEEFDLFGLHVQVFNAFDEVVLENSHDFRNDCSLVIRLDTGQESVLFLGDLSRGAEGLGQWILDTYGAETVRADYIQAGHHGNWGPPISFYGQLMPKEMFFDAPEWILTGEEYDAKDLMAWCEANGIVTHDFRQAPFTVTLHG